MSEERLGALRVMLGCADSTTIGRAQDHWTTEPAARSVTHSRRVIRELVDRGVGESGELDLDDGPHLLGAETHCESYEHGFRERRITNSLWAETRLQSFTRAEDTAVQPDVLAKQDHGVISRQGVT